MPEFQKVTLRDTMKMVRITAVCTAGTLAIGCGAIAANSAFEFVQNYSDVLEENSYDKMSKIDSVAYPKIKLFIEDPEEYVPVNGFIKPYVEEEEYISDAPYETLFDKDYYSLNEQLLDYASTYASFDFHGTQIDGLAVLAQANCESFYMCDVTESISALYPSRWLKFDEASDIEDCCCAYVWAFGGLDNNNYLAWSSGGGKFEQGPLQQRVPESAYSLLTGSASELDTIKWSGLYDDIMVKCPEAIYYCTGTNTLQGGNAVGDRYKIKDNCLIWKNSKEMQLDTLWKRYYSKQDYTPNKYEYLTISAYSHWIPGVISGDNADYAYYGFKYSNAWYDICKGLSSDEGIELIRDKVRKDIDANRALYYEDGKDIEAVKQSLQLVLYNGKDNTGYSEPQKIYNELVSRGIIPDGAMYDCEYGMPHAQSYAIQYLYAYIMLEELLVNRY